MGPRAAVILSTLLASFAWTYRALPGTSAAEPRSGETVSALATEDSAPTPAGVLTRSGDIQGFLGTLRYGEADDEVWRFPSSQTRTTFAAAMRALLAGNIDQVATHAAGIGFEIIKYTDPKRGTFYVLRDRPDGDDISAGGTYVWNPQAVHPVVIEVPHPANEENTDAEGIQLFLSTKAELLLIAGTERRSDPRLSSCDDADKHDYRRSDASHAVAHLFQIAHVEAEDGLQEPLFIQLHGIGASAYRELKAQCRHSPGRDDPELLINISEAFNPSGDRGGEPAEDSFARLLAETVNDEGTIKACLYNEDTTTYGGTLNVQGRYTNGSSDPCDTEATSNSGRFIHLEQSYNARMDELALLVSLIANAIERYHQAE